MLTYIISVSNVLASEKERQYTQKNRMKLGRIQIIENVIALFGVGFRYSRDFWVCCI